MSFSRIIIACIATAILLFAIYLIFYFISMHKTPTTHYTTQYKQGHYAVRSYQSRLVASTQMTGDRQTASKKAFRHLAGFIFGNNSTPAHHKPTRIPMTTPVNLEAHSSGWRMYFFMPHQYTKDTLPIPLDKSVEIQTIPATSYLVLRFSGNLHMNNLKTAETKLMEFVKKEGIKTVGNPIFAFYNPPWTLPFMRHNEVMIALTTPKEAIKHLTQ